MSCEVEEKQRFKWRQWVAPVVVSSAVFAVLFAARMVSPALAVALAGLIAIGGLAVLWRF